MPKEHQKHGNQSITDNLLIRGQGHALPFSLLTDNIAIKKLVKMNKTNAFVFTSKEFITLK